MTSTAAVTSTTSSRTVHPCVVSLSDGARGVEHSVWATLDGGRSVLVTAAASTVRLYTFLRNKSSDTSLRCIATIQVAGSVTFLDRLPGGGRLPEANLRFQQDIRDDSSPIESTSNENQHRNHKNKSNIDDDALVVGWGGAARVSIVAYDGVTQSLPALALLDLTHWQAHWSSVDAAFALHTPSPTHATLAAVLDGGSRVAMASLTLPSLSDNWRFEDNMPYRLPLHALAAHLPTATASSQSGALHSANYNPSANPNIGNPSIQPDRPDSTTNLPIATGWGDMVHHAFAQHTHDKVDDGWLVLHGLRTPSGRLAAGGSVTPLYLTCVAVHPPQQRAAWLWTTPVPADATHVHTHKDMILVQTINSWLTVHASGTILQHVAVNGWAHTTTVPRDLVRPTPNPVVPLALALDGATWTWWDGDTDMTDADLLKQGNTKLPRKVGEITKVKPVTRALVVLRTGQVYVWQTLPQPNHSNGDSSMDNPDTTHRASAYTLLPTGYQLDDMGEVAHASRTVHPSGIWLVGSRLGDSHVLRVVGNRLASSSTNVPIIPPQWIKVEPEKDASFSAPYLKTESGVTNETSNAANLQSGSAPEEDPYEVMLREEEEALYRVVPLDDDPAHNSTKSPQPTKRPHTVDVSAWTSLSKLTILDTLGNLGPIGPATEGPIAATPLWALNVPKATQPTNDTGISTVPAAAPAHVVPVGFGSSGGIAWMTMPGRDDRLILAEHDVSHVQAMWGTPTGWIWMAPWRLLQTTGAEVTQVHLSDYLPSDIASMTELCSLLHVQSVAPGVVWVLAQHEETGAYEYHTLRETKKPFELIHSGTIKGQNLRSLTNIVPTSVDSMRTVQALVWENGLATLATLETASGKVTCSKVPSVCQPVPVEESTGDESTEDVDEEEKKLRDYYSQTNILAADVFTAPRNLFDDASSTFVQSSPRSASPNNPPATEYSSDFDEDDLELYGLLPRLDEQAMRTKVDEEVPDEIDTEATFMAVARQSGDMEIYLISEKGRLSTCVWSCQGIAQGHSILLANVKTHQTPRSRKISVKEMKFFVCGPTQSSDAMQSFCLAIETTVGDVFLYTITRNARQGVHFIRRSLGLVTRTSQEQGRHRTKLSRKGIISKDDAATQSLFEYNSLATFSGLSGQDGLFVMTPRPFWIVAERGVPFPLHHRTRHSAPAGGKSKIVNGFCLLSDGRFLTLHERVGRVGSQRLTLFNGISKVFSTRGLLAGSGMSFERKILGVTVRRIEFIDDPQISTGEHPLYAVLVSREMEIDQSHLNDDGLTHEERDQLKKAKEDEKIKRQVEADLGGFDFEHEWVEEIVREDYFQIDQELGGAPPIFKEAFSLWIMDAANWEIVDSYDLDEYEHGMTLKVMHLSNFKEEPGNKNDEEGDDVPDDLDQSLFVMVGTGTVDHNGEDVTGKGRALLFEITRHDTSNRRPTSRVASLNLAYEKEIFHGPVTTLTCLSIEGKNRLLLGAGCDVNIEQWGNDKLTQVGFFRATMQIADIRIFKSFLLLSDAYDSLYLLIYRESDKSLTLLAKEYEPVAVYAAGLLSRGPSVTFLCHDDRQNLQFLQYAPGDAAARGGNKLVCRADFHLGSQTIHFGNHFCRNSLFAHSATPTSTMAALQQQDSYFGRSDDDQRISVHFGTTDGTLGAVVPLSEPVFWRLAALQSVLANALEPNCGLSPRAWRLYRRSACRGGGRSNDRKKSVIDGDLVSLYGELPTRTQEDLASAVGSTVDAILDNLLELQCGSLML